MRKFHPRNALQTIIFLVFLGIHPHRSYSAQVMTAKEFEIYSKARTVLDLSTQEIIRSYPELLELEFSHNQEQLGLILKKVGENVETFFSTFLNTASVERIRQEKRNLRGYLLESHRQDCQYLLLADLKNGRIRLEESRTDTKGKPIQYKQSRGGLFLTSGFASLPVFLHPLYQSGSRFRYLGKQIVNPEAFVIAFAQDPAARNLIAGTFGAEDEERGCMLFQGLIWVDAGNYQIIRMRTELLAPRYDLGLSGQTTEIWLSEIRLGPLARAYWLPREVIVTHEWKSGAYRNQHRYSDYKLFSVESYEKRESPQTKH